MYIAEWLGFRLKDRENKRREEEITFYKSGQAELQKIAEEIEEFREKTQIEVRLVLFYQYFINTWSKEQIQNLQNKLLTISLLNYGLLTHNIWII